MKRFIMDLSVDPFTVYDTEHESSVDRFYTMADALEYFGLNENPERGETPVDQIHNKTTAMDDLNRVIVDCYNHEEWDTNDVDNFHNMASGAESAQVWMSTAAKMLKMCIAQLEQYSENDFIIDGMTGEDITIQSVKEFIE